MHELVDVMIPVHAPDIERLRRYCLPSLIRNLKGIRTITVVVTDDSFERVVTLCGSLPSVEVVAASALVPVLGDAFRSTRRRAALAVAHRLCALLRRAGCDVRYTPALAERGWFHQQVVKLAYADLTPAPYYLAVDADMICARETHVDELFVNGRPIARLYDRIPPSQVGWYRWSATLLSASPYPSQALAMPPFIFVAAEVRSLPEEVNRSAPTRNLVDLLEILVLGRGSVEHPGRQWERLLLMLPWTEYSLYHTYLFKFGRLQEVYELASSLNLLGKAVWDEADIPGWQGVVAAAHSRESFVFTLLQPSLGDQGQLIEQEFPWLRR
jgi:hypothetical protein